RAPGTDDRPPVCRRCHVGESADCSTPRGRCPNLRHTIRAATVRPRVERLALSGTPPELDDPGIHSGTGSAWRTPKPQRRRTAGMANSVAWLERTSIDGRVCPQCRHRKKRLKLRRKPPGLIAAPRRLPLFRLSIPSPCLPCESRFDTVF